MDIDFDDAFEAIAEAMMRSAKECSSSSASIEAQRRGLLRKGDGKPSQINIWELHTGSRSLRFEWRWYDQSQTFSIRPDMNVLTVELIQEGVVLRSAEERYED